MDHEKARGEACHAMEEMIKQVRRHGREGIYYVEQSSSCVSREQREGEQIRLVRGVAHR